MNQPPVRFVSTPAATLHSFVAAAAQAVGLPAERAELLGTLLTGNDLRGVFSHGTRQIATYARLMRDGELNARPQLSVVRETPCSALVDGDGGLGYFPAHEATRLAIAKAKSAGVAAAVTRNHGHFGAAGLYTRMTLEHDLLAYVTSGHQLNLQPGGHLFDAAGGSPMSFSAPAAEEDDLVLDFGAMHDLYRGSPHREHFVAVAPGMVLRSIGLGEICQAWGGLLSGLSLQADAPRWQYTGANQGSLIVALRIDLFTDPADFKAQIDAYVRRVRELQPLPGFENAYLAGGAEAERQRRYSADGVPVGDEHRLLLEELAAELGIDSPWADNGATAASISEGI